MEINTDIRLEFNKNSFKSLQNLREVSIVKSQKTNKN